MDTVADHLHNFHIGDWPFADPHNAVAISTIQVFRLNFPILRVSHHLDGDWQVLCDTTLDDKDAIVVCLGCAFQRDRSIGELPHLPMGWAAWRDFVGGPWTKEEKPIEPDNEEHPVE